MARREISRSGGFRLVVDGGAEGAVSWECRFARRKRSSVVSASRLRCSSKGGVNASSQWMEGRKYSIARDGETSSIRNGRIGMPQWTARSTSRITCDESLAPEENTRIMTRLLRMASTMASPYGRPARRSRGAIQQRTFCASRVAQPASAMALSREQ